MHFKIRNIYGKDCHDKLTKAEILVFLGLKMVWCFYMYYTLALVEKEKLKRGLDNAKKEGELLKILVNELHREIDGKDDQIKEIATQLAEAKDDVLKLEEANSRLKGQVLVCAHWHWHVCQLKISFYD